MRHRILPPLLGLVLFCSATVLAADDSSIARDLAGRLRQAKTEGNLRDFRIGVKVEDGVVWLSGSVRDDHQRQRALDLARRVAGVRLVVNDLECPADPRIPDHHVSTPPSHWTEPVTGAVGEPEAIGELANPPVAQVASSMPPPRQPELFTQPRINDASMAAIAPLPPGALLLVPGYSAVPAYPVRPGGSPATDQPEQQPQVKPAQVRHTVPKPVPVARRKPARLVSHQHMAGPPIQAPPIQEGMCQNGGCHYGAHSDGMIHHDGMSYGGGMGFDGGSYGGSYGAPVPEYGAAGMSGVMYDNPQMPGYAWPSYASHPNYAAVTYPRQYSPMAWPYIGPFYPYPQVPLGWRKVSLEWDDGWWMLDFKSK